jgi:hypothetical protein
MTHVFTNFSELKRSASIGIFFNKHWIQSLRHEKDIGKLNIIIKTFQIFDIWF